MSKETRAAKPEEINPPPASRDIRAYIEEQLDTLAKLASARGEPRLAVALQMAALEAARPSGR